VTEKAIGSAADAQGVSGRARHERGHAIASCGMTSGTRSAAGRVRRLESGRAGFRRAGRWLDCRARIRLPGSVPEGLPRNGPRDKYFHMPSCGSASFDPCVPVLSGVERCYGGQTRIFSNEGRILVTSCKSCRARPARASSAKNTKKPKKWRRDLPLRRPELFAESGEKSACCVKMTVEILGAIAEYDA